ncbi:MAG: hypothetical protein WD069_01165 [Planctomycetales bacterium]
MATAWAVGGCLLSVGAGCSHLLEARSIAQFTEELGRGDLDGLKSSTSPEFERKALRRPDAIDDLKILKLPTEKPTVVQVEDRSETEKRVVVEVGESGRKLLYKLVRDEGSGRWVVDDIYVRQKQDGVIATRSVTQQMDLLLTAREFLHAWRQGSRNDVLGVATQEFGQALGELPPPYLESLTRRVAGESAERKSQPEATVDHDVAIVSIPRRAGKLVVTCRTEEGQWKVADVAVESRIPGERLPSARGQAAALVAAVRFLDAYAAGDKQALEPLCVPKLYRGSLRAAALREFPLPDSRAALPGHELRVIGGRAEFEVAGKTKILKIGLQRPALAEVSTADGAVGDSADQSEPYRVHAVTMYELDGSQERRLSAVFTAQPVMEIFAEAFANRDLGLLRQVSTADFRERLWDRIDAAVLEDSAFDVIANAEPRVLGQNFRGALTEITVTQGERPMTYVLQDVDGELCVDDVLVPAVGRPESLKRTMETLLPVRAYGEALSRGELEWLQRSSSDDFNRLVWGQVRQVPPAAFPAIELLRLPLARIEKKGEHELLIVLGNGRRGARVTLLEQHGRRLVDDIQLVSEDQAVGLKGRLRQELAARMLAESSPRTVPPVPIDGLSAGPVHQRPISIGGPDGGRDELAPKARPSEARRTAARAGKSRIDTLRTEDFPLDEVRPTADRRSARAGFLPSVSLDPELGDVPLH